MISRISMGLVAVSLTMLSTGAFASEKNNGDLKIGLGLDQGLSIVGQYQDTYNFAIGNDGVAADYIFNKGSFSSDVPFTWYAGAGAWIGWKDSGGLRVPLGLDWNFSTNWDAYAQVIPGLNLRGGAKLDIDAALGMRYSF